MKLLTTLTLLLVCTAAAASPASPRPTLINLTLTPSHVHRGSSVAIRGHADGCPRGDTVTILSRAFPATHNFAGVPAVYAPVGAAGAFHTSTTIPRARRVGRYTVTARCGGGNLGVAPVLTVLR